MIPDEGPSIHALLDGGLHLGSHSKMGQTACFQARPAFADGTVGNARLGQFPDMRIANSTP